MRPIRRFSAGLTILLLLQSILLGSGGRCDARGSDAMATHEGHGRHAAAVTDARSASHASGGVTRLAVAEDPSCTGMAGHGCDESGMPAGSACSVAACATMTALVAPSVAASDSPVHPHPTWASTGQLRSTIAAPETPPPRA